MLLSIIETSGCKKRGYQVKFSIDNSRKLSDRLKF